MWLLALRNSFSAPQMQSQPSLPIIHISTLQKTRWKYVKAPHPSRKEQSWLFWKVKEPSGLFHMGLVKRSSSIWKTVWTILLKSFLVERGAERERGNWAGKAKWAGNTSFLLTFQHFSFVLPYVRDRYIFLHNKEKEFESERERQISTRLKFRKAVSSLGD